MINLSSWRYFYICFSFWILWNIKRLVFRDKIIRFKKFCHKIKKWIFWINFKDLSKIKNLISRTNFWTNLLNLASSWCFLRNKNRGNLNIIIIIGFWISFTTDLSNRHDKNKDSNKFYKIRFLSSFKTYYSKSWI